MINKLTLLLLVGFFALCGCTADDETLASVTYGTPTFTEVNPGIGRAEFVWSPNDDDAVYTEIYANDALLQKVYYTAGTSEVSRIIAMDSGEYSFYIVNVNADDSRSSKISYSKKVTVYDESDGEDLEAMTLDLAYISQDDENGGRISWQTDDETIVGNTVSYVDSDGNPCLVYSAVEDGECYYSGAAFGTEFTYVSHYLLEEGAIDSFLSESKSGVFENQTIMYTYEADGQEYELKRVYVSSVTEMIKYMGEDCTGYHVTLKKGTYRINGSDMRDESIIPVATADICGNVTQAIFLVAGERNVYDFNDSTIILEIKSVYANCGYELFPLHFMGNHNIVKNYIQIDEGEEEDYPANGCVNVTMDGSYNIVENIETHSKGSYPYGYGEVFGKGSGAVINIFKHCAINLRGHYNLIDSSRFYHKAFGHCMFSQGSKGGVARHCYFEGEMTTGDFIVDDPRTSGANGLGLARPINVEYYTTWGYYVPVGLTFSCVEDCMRAYGTGSTNVNGNDYTNTATAGDYFHDNITVDTRSGTSLRNGGGIGVSGCKSGFTCDYGDFYACPAWYNPSRTSGGHYVERITALGCDTSVGMGQNKYADDCYGNAQHGSAIFISYDSDSSSNIELTLLPFKTDNTVLGGYKGTNGTGHAAFVRGINHNITFHYLDLRPDETYGWTRKGESLTIDLGGNSNNTGYRYMTYSDLSDDEEDEEEEEDDSGSNYAWYGDGKVISYENSGCAGVTLINNNKALGYTPYRIVLGPDAGRSFSCTSNVVSSYSSSTNKNEITTAMKSDIYFIDASQIDYDGNHSETAKYLTSGTAESNTTVTITVGGTGDDYASNLGLGSVDSDGLYSYEDEYFEQGPEVYMKHPTN